MSKPAATAPAGPARAPAGDPTPDQRHRSALGWFTVYRDHKITYAPGMNAFVVEPLGTDGLPIPYPRQSMVGATHYGLHWTFRQAVKHVFTVTRSR